jgi:cytochrome c biogenesis protein CcdA
MRIIMVTLGTLGNQERDIEDVGEQKKKNKKKNWGGAKSRLLFVLGFSSIAVFYFGKYILLSTWQPCNV